MGHDWSFTKKNESYSYQYGECFTFLFGICFSKGQNGCK